MKNRGTTGRSRRGRRKHGARRQVMTPNASTVSRGAAVPRAAAVPKAAPVPQTPPPVAGISHRQVLSDIKKIGIIGGAGLFLLLLLFVIWR